MKEDKRKFNGRKPGSKNKVKGQIVGEVKKFASEKVNRDKYQSQTLEEFLQRREGETFEQWNKRTAKKRIHGVNKDNKIKVAARGKIYVEAEKLKGMNKEVQIRIRSKFTERPYDFLENYAFIMRWASIRYGIAKEDIEIAFFFYNKGAFSQEEFNRVCIQLGTVRGLWSRWIKKPYITQGIIVTQENIVKEMGYYQLTAEFLRLLRSIYEALSKVNKLTLTIRSSANYKRNVVPHELNEFLQSLNRDIDDVINGKLKPHFKQTEGAENRN